MKKNNKTNRKDTIRQKVPKEEKLTKSTELSLYKAVLLVVGTPLRVLASLEQAFREHWCFLSRHVSSYTELLA